MTFRVLITVLVIALATCAASAQFVQTGNVQNDFPATSVFPDPGGQDVGMPPLLINNISGWDMENIAVLYDELTDTLHVGIDCFDPMTGLGICGDADGDGDPGVTSGNLNASGGADRPDFMNTESFTFGLDLDNDGTLDVIAGLPLGADILTGYTVATFNGFISAPFLAFDTSLPMNTGTVHASPSASAPDLEFTITNFSSLAAPFYQPGQTTIGIHAFMGSQEDDGIGEDFFPGLFTQSIPLPPCYPAPNYLAFLDVVPVTGGHRAVVSYGSLAGYGCCGLASPDFDMAGKTLPVMGGPVVNVGLPGDFSTICVADFGAQNVPGRAVTCKELSGDILGLSPGTVVYMQILAYPVQFGSGPFITSNTIVYVQP